MPYRPTAEQTAILEHDYRHHARVLAGPGTGKSATLVALLDGLLDQPDPPRIKLLTFTRAATAELAKKVSDHPAAAAQRPSTIHSFAISILLRNQVGTFPHPLRIADKWEERTIVKPTLARRIGVRSTKLNSLIREMSSDWESLQPEQDPGVEPQDRARFNGGWNEHRSIYGYTLLSELPYACLHALRDHPDLEGIDFDLLIVDEYQDLNACDLALLHTIADRGCSIIGAGDDDQSIYAMRRAAPQGIRRFPGEYPDCGDYALSITQRCGRRVIEWATYVIQGDPDRVRDRPPLHCAEGSADGEVALLAFPGDRSEAGGVGDLVQRLIEENQVPPNEILILLRSDHNGAFSGPLKEALTRREIEYSDPDQITRLLAEPVNRQTLAACRLLVNASDSLAWATLLHFTQGVGITFVDYIYERARAARVQFGDALLGAYTDGFPDGPRASSNLATNLIRAVQEWLANHQPPAETPDNGWGHWIVDIAGGDVAPAPTDELADLLQALDDLIDEGPTLGQYLSQITPLGTDYANAQSRGVRIMTMNSAKGLTVRATIIVGLEQEIIPRPDCDVQEERRLLYVGDDPLQGVSVRHVGST